MNNKYNSQKLEILLSAMNIKDISENNKILHNMNIGNEVISLTINQDSKNSKVSRHDNTEHKTDIKYKNNKDNEDNNNMLVKNRIIFSNDIGTSKSRNLAISNAIGDICIIAEEDVVYENGYTDIIKNAYEKYKDYDIICFFVESSNPQRKIKRMRTGKVKILRTMRLRSFEITFKREKLIQSGVNFDENFGPGTIYDHGEETIFINDCINRGLKIKFVNKKIATVHPTTSTWFKGYDEQFFKVEGAKLIRMSPKHYKLLMLQFAIRKYKIYKKTHTFKQIMDLMKMGANEYEEVKRNIYKSCKNS